MKKPGDCIAGLQDSGAGEGLVSRVMSRMQRRDDNVREQERKAEDVVCELDESRVEQRLGRNM
jgi:hypothetical protein